MTFQPGQSGNPAGRAVGSRNKKTLAAEAALLLADEPTARLDEANALAVGALFARIARERGAAVVCATHDSLVVAEADDVLAL